jgi:hypothetical protein
MKRLLYIALMSITCGCSKPPETKPAPAAKTDPAAMALDAGASRLPAQAGVWSRPATMRRITADTIFDYMDGGGEMYLAYRFDHLDVLDYTAADRAQGTILVELYYMKSPDDAFGLLSTDWTGEPTLSGEEHTPTPASTTAPLAAPPHRALYGAGLLRLWSGPLYVRVLASRETAVSRDAVLKIGRAIVGSGPSFAPDLLWAVPGDVAATPPGTTPTTGFLRADRTCFLRSYLVLNSQYFLASRDILGLGLEAAAVTTEFAPTRPGARPTRLILVEYGSLEAAAAAAASFVDAYLPGAARPDPAAGRAKTEHGFVAWSVVGRGVAIVLDAESNAAASKLAALVARAISGVHVPRS